MIATAHNVQAKSNATWFGGQGLVRPSSRSSTKGIGPNRNRNQVSVILFLPTTYFCFVPIYYSCI
jgi:hypothetical protein